MAPRRKASQPAGTAKPPDDTRTRLLNAAAEVFAERGFDNATVREICTRAQSNVALVNYYFGDKLELYTEVFRRSLQHAGQPTRPLPPPDAEPVAALQFIVSAMLERAFEKGDDANLRYRLMFNEFVRPSVATARVVDIVLRPVYDRLRDIVGAILNLPPDHQTTRLSVHSILGQVAHFAHSKQTLLWPQMEMTPTMREVVAGHITESTLAYLREIRAKVNRPPGSRRARK